MDLGLLGPPVVAPEARRRCPSTEPTPRWAYGLASHQTRTVRPRLRAPGGTGPLTRFCSRPPQLGPAQRPAHKFPSRVRRGGRGPGRATQWGQPSRKSASRLVVQVPVVHFVCGSRGNAASPQPFAACPALQPIRTVERTCPRQPPSQGGDVGAFVCHPAIQLAAVPTTSPQPKDSITPRYLWRARPGVSFFLPELLSLVWTWVTFPGAGQSRQSRPPRGPVCCSLPSGQVPPTLGWDPQHRPGLAVAHRLARGSASRVTDGVPGSG